MLEIPNVRAAFLSLFRTEEDSKAETSPTIQAASIIRSPYTNCSTSPERGLAREPVRGADAERLIYRARARALRHVGQSLAISFATDSRAE